MRWMIAFVLACHGGGGDTPSTTPPSPPSNPPPSNPPPPPPALPDASQPQADDPVACTTDADCPRLACGPCKADEVVTRHYTSIECFRNPCPTAKARCADHVCKVAP
jgi:hypothetical protein